MKVSVNWLKDYLDIRLSPKVLAERLTMAGLEVADQQLKGKDVVLDIEVTANRPDCLSILGIVQEVAAVTGLRPKFRKLKPVAKTKTKDSLNKNFILIQDKRDCAFYRGCLIKGVKIGPSPVWLRERLEILGLRAVNNVVDITNYCLLEYGQPLHAFDYDKISEQIIVRRAKQGEIILCLDGAERRLTANILVISDKRKAIAIAGIMGDKLSEVDSLTKNILLESAYFNPLLIRKASQELGLTTESSYRFERRVDFERVILAQNKAVDLITQICGGRLIDIQERGKRLKSKPKNIYFDFSRASRLLGYEVKPAEAKRIFSALGFVCKNATQKGLEVSVPALRRDVNIEEDLAEEFARLNGYVNIASTLPAIRSVKIQNPAAEEMKPQVRTILSALGFKESINYSLLSKDDLDKLSVQQEALRLQNPLSVEQEYLRPLLAVGLLNCLAYNFNHKNIDVKLFELGHIFGMDYKEGVSLGIIAAGKFLDNWQVRKDFDYYNLKGSIQELVHRLGFNKVMFQSKNNPDIMSLQCYTEIICQDKSVGFMGQVSKDTLMKFGIKGSLCVYYAEICLSTLCLCLKSEKKFVPLAVFPSISRDISMIVKTSVGYGEIENIIREETKGYLRNVMLRDLYKGQQIPSGCLGMTLSLELGLNDRTLTDAEATQIQQRIQNRLQTELDVRIR